MLIPSLGNDLAMSEENRFWAEIRSGGPGKFAYLIRGDRNNPDQVLRWVETAEVQTERMAQVLTIDDSIGVTPRGCPCKNQT